jgi:hypothetical protein
MMSYVLVGICKEVVTVYWKALFCSPVDAKKKNIYWTARSESKTTFF